MGHLVVFELLLLVLVLQQVCQSENSNQPQLKSACTRNMVPPLLSRTKTCSETDLEMELVEITQGALAVQVVNSIQFSNSQVGKDLQLQMKILGNISRQDGIHFLLLLGPLRPLCPSRFKMLI